MVAEDGWNLFETAWETNYLKECLGIIFNFPEVAVAIQKLNCLASIGFSTPVNYIYCHASGIVFQRVQLLVLLGTIRF